jgi:putative membrane protein
MLQLIAHWVLQSLALYLTARIVSGVELADFGSALVTTLVLSLLNILVKPLLLLLTLPLTILTLGLFTFVINALVLLLASTFVPGFSVNGLGNALIASIVLSVISLLLRSLVR